jgi:hypothetical protein
MPGNFSGVRRPASPVSRVLHLRPCTRTANPPKYRSASEALAKTFWLDHHAAVLLDIPIHRGIADQCVSHKFDLTWFTIEQHAVAFFLSLRQIGR